MGVDLVVTAITPGIALALMIYLTDRYDREPLHLLLKVFAFGMLSVIPVMIIEIGLNNYNIFSGLWRAAYSAFIVAGFTEEYIKRKVVLKFAYNHPAFNEKLDGIVYAVFSSLGFATVENIMYVVFRYANVSNIGLQRAIFAVPAHMLFAVTMGYYLSMAKYDTDERISNYFMKLSLLIPMILHGIYNYILMSNHEKLIVFFIPFVLFLWGYNLRKLNRYYQESRAFYHNENN